jgi:hypothetical protein
MTASEKKYIFLNNLLYFLKLSSETKKIKFKIGKYYIINIRNIQSLQKKNYFKINSLT